MHMHKDLLGALPRNIFGADLGEAVIRYVQPPQGRHLEYLGREGLEAV